MTLLELLRIHIVLFAIITSCTYYVFLLLCIYCIIFLVSLEEGQDSLYVADSITVYMGP